jgi:DNA-binding MarR family transcriptional regulator
VSHQTALSQYQLDSIRQANLGHRLLALSKDFEKRLLAQYALSGYGDIRPLHGAVLRNLELQGTLVTSLAQRAGITHRAIAKIIEELEKMGYVRRLADKVDGRATRVWFSKYGLALLQDSSSLIENIIGFYKSKLGDELVSALDLSLKKIIDALEIAIPAAGQQALINDSKKTGKYMVSHNIGRYLAELADDYARRCTELMEEKKHFGIQIGHTAVLSHLGAQGMLQRELAEAAGISQQAIGKQVKPLQELGYITVSPDVNDKRARRVSFTNKGYAFINDLIECFEQIKLDYIKRIGAKNFENLLVMLKTFISELNLSVPI